MVMMQVQTSGRATVSHRSERAVWIAQQSLLLHLTCDNSQLATRPRPTPKQQQGSATQTYYQCEQLKVNR